MQERKKLGCDSLFGADFFEVPEVKTATLDVSFPLPPNAEHLESFFNSSRGKQFKSAMERLIAELKTWAQNNQIDATPLTKFKKNYVDYSGINVKTNKLYLPLYQEGVPLLAKIIEFINDSSILLSHRKKVVKNLVNDIAVCSPGSHTHLLNAYLALLAFGNLPVTFAEYRRNVAGQLVDEEIRRINCIELDWVMHYINAVLNRYSDMLGMPAVEDKYAGDVLVRILDPLLAHFEKNIFKIINVTDLIEYYLSELNIESIPNLIKVTVSKANKHYSSNYDDIIDDLEVSLDFYGQEGDSLFLYHDDIFETEDNLTYRLSWKAKYVLFLSIFNRLKNSEKFIDSAEYQAQLVNIDLAKEVEGYYIPDRSLRYAYIHQSNPKNCKNFQPFIPCYVEKLAELNKTHNKLSIFIISKKLTLSQRKELISGIFEYLADPEFKEVDDPAQQKANLNYWLMQAIQRIKNKKEIICFLKDACAQGFTDIVKLILDQGVDIDGTNVFSPIYVAAENGQTEMVQFLLEHGAKVDGKLASRFTPLMIAAKNGHIKTVELLHEAGANVFALTNDDMTPFLFAVAANKVDVCNFFVEHSEVSWHVCEPNAACVAARHGANDVLLFLLLTGADDIIDRKDNGKTPLDYAIAAGHLLTVQILLQSGATLCQKHLRAVNSKEHPELYQVVNQLVMLQNYREKSFPSHLSRDLQAKRDAALDVLRSKSLDEHEGVFAKAFSEFSEIDDSLLIFSNYESDNPKRAGALHDLEGILIAAYTAYSQGTASAEILKDWRDKIKLLSAAVKLDHMENGALGKFGLFTKSRLARQLDKLVAEAAVAKLAI